MAPDIQLEDGRIPAFQAKDIQGQEHSQDIFQEKAVTVVNMWFNGCTACVQEMPSLEALHKEWEGSDIQLLGLNVDQPTEATLKEAEALLMEQGVSYLNLFVEPGQEAYDRFVNSVMAYPTTLLVNRQGEVVGEPIVGSIDSPETILALKTQVDAVLAADGSSGAAKG